MNGKIFDLVNNLDEHLDHAWTVKEMAEKAGLSVSHFPVLFKADVKMPPGAYLKEARLQEARHLLETTHDYVSQIGIKVGMPNLSHFTRDFKKRYGLTPTKYRKQFQKKRQAKLLKDRNRRIRREIVVFAKE